MKIAQVNGYLAHKQHLLPGSKGDDVVQTTRDIVALHATAATGPYFSLWARVADFQHQMLEDALYGKRPKAPTTCGEGERLAAARKQEKPISWPFAKNFPDACVGEIHEQRTLARWLCMRVTLHVVPGDEVAFFHQAYPLDFLERPVPPQFRGGGLLAGAGLCKEDEAKALLEDLHRRVLAVVAEHGPSTVQQIGKQVPEFEAKIRHDVGKPYEGEFSIGSRLVGGMCARGLLIRARPRGTWRSNLYEYALPSDWLPGVDLGSVTQDEARAWLVRRYLAAFGPATLDDVQWWMGLTQGDAQDALDAVAPDVVEGAIEGVSDEYLMLADDAEWLRDFTPPDTSYAFLLPSLDPYIMGYHDRQRFLAAEHRKKVFDRAGNAVPTVWVDGRVVGVWGQRKDGQAFFELFEPVGDAERALVDREVQSLEDFLDGEALPPGIRTPFTRSLE